MTVTQDVTETSSNIILHKSPIQWFYKDLKSRGEKYQYLLITQVAKWLASPVENAGNMSKIIVYKNTKIRNKLQFLLYLKNKGE